MRCRRGAARRRRARVEPRRRPRLRRGPYRPPVPPGGRPMNPSPTLRRLPHWVGAARFTSNAYAWSDHDVPGDLLGWIEDSGPTADDRPGPARCSPRCAPRWCLPPRAVAGRVRAQRRRRGAVDDGRRGPARLRRPRATTARAARRRRFADADEERRTPSPRASHDEAAPCPATSPPHACPSWPPRARPLDVVASAAHARPRGRKRSPPRALLSAIRRFPRPRTDTRPPPAPPLAA